MSASTTGTSTRARCNLTVRGACFPVTTVSATRVPALPLISAVACCVVLPAIALPSTAVITSPRRMPPRCAGEPSNTVSTFSPASTASTFIPTPSNAPSVASSNSRYSFGSK
jgi:hypothetical protein